MFPIFHFSGGKTSNMLNILFMFAAVKHSTGHIVQEVFSSFFLFLDFLQVTHKCSSGIQTVFIFFCWCLWRKLKNTLYQVCLCGKGKKSIIYYWHVFFIFFYFDIFFSRVIEKLWKMSSIAKQTFFRIEYRKWDINLFFLGFFLEHNIIRKIVKVKVFDLCCQALTWSLSH